MSLLGRVRTQFQGFFNSPVTQMGVALLLVISAVTISWEITLKTHTSFQYRELINRLEVINTYILYVFAIEILLRIFAFGFNYFKSGWNIFDFVVVGLSVLTIGTFFQIIRTFRLFLFLRTFSVFPSFQHLITALGQAIPRIFSTFMLLLLAMYIFAVWGVIEYSVSFPELFGNLSIAFETLTHAVLMGRTWSELYENMTKVDADAAIYIYAMVIVLNFLLLKLVVGIIINALHFQNIADQEQKKHSFILGWIRGKNTNHHDSPLSADTKMIVHEILKIKADLLTIDKKLDQSLQGKLPDYERNDSR